MHLIIEALNRPKEAYKRQHSPVSWLFVLMTVLIEALIDPVFNHWVHSGEYPVEIDGWRMLILFASGWLTYLAIGISFFLVGRLFGSITPLKTYIRSWGISYPPTILCALLVSFAETFFTLFWNQSLWALFLNIAFLGILIWKSLLYILYLKEIAGLTGRKLWGAFLLGGLAILILAFLNVQLGLKTPVL